MAIPIKIEKVSLNSNRHHSEQTKYLITVEEKKSKWELTYQCSKEELIRFKKEIEDLITNTSNAETLNVTEEQEKIIEKYYKTDSICSNCKDKLTHQCVTCLFSLQSPLERKMFVALNNTYIRFTPQYPVDVRGELSYTHSDQLPNTPVNKKNILTTVDFFFQKGDRKLCVYTDGETYHKGNPEQAAKDNIINNKLRDFGYTVLRFTGKEINENMDSIIHEIKQWHNNKN
ncbi:MAG: DUF559 domain-containing protein [bacterium]|nr:DUF559 domain-containing protein [bacterium]